MAAPSRKPEVLVQRHTTQSVRCPPKCMTVESDKARGRWYARVPHGHTFDHVIDPRYFEHFAIDETQGKGLRAGDLIEIEPESMEWYAELRVLAVNTQTRTTMLRLRGAVERYTEELPDGYRWAWNGPDGMWAVVQLPRDASDKEKVVGQHFVSQAAALMYLQDIIPGFVAAAA